MLKKLDKNFYLSPSLLSADFSCLKEQIRLVEESGCEWLHLDVMDGHFVPNITFGPIVIKSLRSSTNLIFDTHLMIENPDKYITDFVKAGSDIITVHQETCTHLHRTLCFIKDHNIKAGVALNPSTPINTIFHILDCIDLILIMTVNPGFGGQKFISSMLPKIKDIRQVLDRDYPNIILEVDGGINLNTLPILIKAGANAFVAGSAIFDNDIKETIKKFKEIIYKSSFQ